MDQHSKLGYREGLVSVILNLLLFVLKYYAGIASASLALIADAWHTLSDSLTSLVVILGIKLSSKKPDKEHMQEWIDQYVYKLQNNLLAADQPAVQEVMIPA